MALTKADRAYIEELHTRLALRWTEAIKPDVPPPTGFSQPAIGWDFNTYAERVWKGWSSMTAHGEGDPFDKRRSGTQGGRRLFSTRALALRAMRSEMELRFAKALREVDRQIEAAEKEQRDGN